jgi:predicted dehydrogenase
VTPRPRRPSRRAALAGGLAAASLAGAAHAATRARPYRVGVIGAGWFGKLDLHALMAVAPVEVVALCDVDSAVLARARDEIRARTDTVTPQRRTPATYADYRQMLTRHGFDIVIVATPDHWHALAGIAAMNKGAHVYLEKPICVDVVEGRALVNAARANNVVVQCGTQRRTTPAFIEARDHIVRAGKLGKVGVVEVASYLHQRPPHMPPNGAPPASLDWDAYCGPARLIPYNSVMHELFPAQWRAYTNFGNGYVGDVGVHFIDAARWILDLGAPHRVSAEGAVLVDKQSLSDVPDTMTANFDFDDVLMTWTNRQWGRGPAGEGWGAAIHGENGTLRLFNNSYDFLPVDGERVVGAAPPEAQSYRQDMQLHDWERPLIALTRGNMRDFVAAIEAGARPASDVESVHVSTSCCILANTAMKLGRPLAWDGAAERYVGDDEANTLLARPYRAPWAHPNIVARR